MPTRPSRRRHVRRTLAEYPPPTPQPTPCRLWQGPLHNGYGQRTDHQPDMHVWVWEQINGPVPVGMLVRHRCDQPLCYRYDHLVLGTHADNAADRAERGRHGTRRLRPADVVDIRDRLAHGAEVETLAYEYDVHRNTIQRIWRRDTYRNF